MDERLPALRSDLEIVTRRARGKPIDHFLADKEGEGRVFRLGPREHLLCRRMDGESSVDDLLLEYERTFGERLDPGDLEAFIEHLRGEGFLQDQAARPASLPEVFASEESMPWGRVRLARGDGFISWLAARSGWAFSLPAKVAAGILVFLGLNTLVREWALVTQAVYHHWGFIFVVTVVLSTALLVHAPRNLVQAVACKRGGGYVSEIGVSFFYYVIPGLYCRYSDIRWLENKSKLQKTILAGIGYQLVIWSVAMIGWFASAPYSLMRGIWLALACGSGIGLLLFVANPLVQGDGYRLLTTWLEIPRLRERSLAAFGSWLFRRPSPEPLTRRERKGFLIFGALAAAFTVGYLAFFAIMTGRGLTAVYQGPGFLVALGFAGFLFAVPLKRTVGGSGVFIGMRDWVKGMASGKAWRFWLLIGIAVILFLPYPYETGGPFTMLPGTQSEVHCEIDGGRVAEVNVHEGQFVKAGEPLGRIDQREYAKNLEFTQASLEETEAKLQFLRKELAMLENPPDIESVIALEAEARRLRTLVTNYETELELTVLRAPMDGMVVTPEIQMNVGTYLRKGDLFATIEQPERVRVEIHVPEEDAPQVEVGARVKVVAWAFPRDTYYGEVEEIAPVAAMPLEDPEVPNVNAVRVIAGLENDSLRFRSQTTGFAKIKTDLIPVWYVFSRLIVRWFQVQVWYWIP